MRVMMLVLTGVVALGFGYSEAFAAKRSSSTNPDRQYYQGAATCGGGAACYRSGSQKSQKAHKTVKSN
jgi:hypothetical protein